MVLKQFKLNIMMLLLMEIVFFKTRETTAVLLTASKNFNVGVHLNLHCS